MEPFLTSLMQAMNETDYISIHTGGDLEVDMKPAPSRLLASFSRFSLSGTPSPKSRSIFT